MEANVRLQRMSVGMFETFQAETGHPADFRQIGYLFVLTLPQHVEDFRNNMEMWRRVGLTEARWVDASEAARMVPVLNVDDVLGCTFCPTDGIASPADVTAGYAAAARRHGARLKEGAELTGIDVAGGRVQGVRTSAGDIATRLVFDCAGAWAASIGRMAGLEIPVLPYRRQVAVTGTFPTVPRTNPMTVDFQTSFYFHPEGDGVLMGMSDRSEPPGYATDVNWDFLEKMFVQAERRAPPPYDADRRRRVSIRRPVTSRARSCRSSAPSTSLCRRHRVGSARVSGIRAAVPSGCCAAARQ